MNWKTGFTVGLLLVSAQVSDVMAGVEPSPFQPEINQLGAVANILNSAEFRIIKTMSAAPVCLPSDPCNGLAGDVNRLEAINNQLSSAQYMVESMIYEVMGVEPSPFFGDLIAPMELVRDAAMGIVHEIEGYGLEDDVAIEFFTALQDVSTSALDMAEALDDGIDEITQAMLCGAAEDETSCKFPCEWVPEATGAAGGECRLLEIGS